LRDGRFALGCALSFLTGIGLYGSVYLMPVFLAFVRQHGAFEIGRIMLVTGMAQLVTAPIAVQLERRIDPRLLSVIGFALFAVGLGLSAFETRETDFSEMLWPQIIRGSAIMLCLLAPTRLALGHLLPDAVPDASGLFNLMRNLGGAIGIALIDTVIWTRAPFHAGHLAERLLARDGRAAALVGIPQTALAGPAPRPDDPIVQAIVRPLIERASLVSATNEAWAMVAAFVAAGAMIAFASVVARGKNALTWSDEHASR
jgi:DHA2 family multidrug resistance protein